LRLAFDMRRISGLRAKQSEKELPMRAATCGRLELAAHCGTCGEHEEVPDCLPSQRQAEPVSRNLWARATDGAVITVFGDTYPLRVRSVSM